MTRTFFERLLPHLVEEIPAGGELHGALSPLAESVRRNIARILNSREGDAASCPEYGLPDLRGPLKSLLPSALGKEDKSYRIERLLKQRIADYEPRLAHVDVKYIPRQPGAGHQDAFIAHFLIQGRLLEHGPHGTRTQGTMFLATHHNPEGWVAVTSPETAPRP